MTQVGGQVGIGTLAPAYQLDVSGTLRATGAATFGSSLTSSCTVSAVKVTTSSNVFQQNTYGSIGFINYSDGATYYQLVTDAGSSTGSFNGLRPYAMDMATGNLTLAGGNVTMNHSTGALVGKAISGTTGSYSGAVSCAGLTCTTINTNNNQINAGGGTVLGGMLFSYSNIQAQGCAAPASQGAYLGWNRIWGSGSACFINSPGTGGGGWEWVAFLSSNTLQTVAAILSQAGALTCAGGLTVSSRTVSLPAGSVGAAAISGLASIATTGAASNLSGVLGTANIPSLPASQITAGTFGVGSFSGAITCSSLTTTVGNMNVLPGILAINNSQDGGYTRGLR
jgi:hypothetical protein